jgi:sec-independent protein translocase protein TatC
LRKYQRQALVGLAVAAAILTPADLGTMFMLLTPMVLLYELSIWLVRLVGGGKRRTRAEEPAAGA